MYIGCHVSIAQGIWKAPARAANLGCEIMQIFTRSPQGGKASELTPEVIQNFQTAQIKNKIHHVYVHAPYYINLASQNNRICYSSVSIIRDELERASLIKADFVIVHPGTAKDLGTQKAIAKIIALLKKCLTDYQGSAKLLLENSAGAGHVIGSNIIELNTIIQQVNNPQLTGICLDTQHSFASGYDWTKFNQVLTRIDFEIGLKKIKLIHANDSLTKCNSKKDRHAHIGDGLIGTNAFKQIVAWAQKNNIDMILETKLDKVTEDVQLLKSFRS